MMQWSVKKQTSPQIDGAFKYVAGADNALNVTVLFSRQLKAGQQVSVAGTGKVDTGNQKPVFGRSRVSCCFGFWRVSTSSWLGFGLLEQCWVGVSALIAAVVHASSRA
jgi:hypothetical protein